MTESRTMLIHHFEPLTKREAQVLLWTAEGKTAWEAGQILGISEGTVRAHLVHALDKLDAVNKAHAVTRCFVSGILMAKHCFVVAFAALLFGHISDHAEMRTRSPTHRRVHECRQQPLSAGSRCRV